MKYQRLSLVEAHDLVKSKRKMIRPNNGFWIQLIEYEKKLFGKNTVTMVPTRLGNDTTQFTAVLSSCQGFASLRLVRMRRLSCSFIVFLGMLPDIYEPEVRNMIP